MFSFFKRFKSIPFSTSLKSIISESRLEAIRLQNDYIDVGHFMLAILTVPDSSAAVALNQLLVSPMLFQQRLETTLAGNRINPSQPPPTGSIPLTLELEESFGRMGRVARELNAVELEAIHTLMPLLVNPNSSGARVCAEFGLTFNVLLNYLAKSSPTTLARGN
ncbi:Clp protease N-terminal domain-containing protein [Hymenobacter norwichensis]|uniref:Clp protease N-terminal domain-containing protein n=1 Tax=Hymenobacter norwichensis TaxID=223903 RepID=UPI0008FFC89C|nr:Clp protease N-terminal domain-containing protein [Hymenobacter norwichensis]